jgi:type IV pilus assembly protein PilP
MRAVVLAVVLCLGAPLVLQAQAPAAPAVKPPVAGQTATIPAADAPAAPGPAAAPQTALEPHGYTYNPNGRRDPFVSLVRRGAESPGTTQGQRPPGLPGLSAAEISLRGTLKGRDGFVAMVQGADNKTYLVRTGDRLLDGTIRAITADTLVIRQRVNDPLTLDTERDVRKVLRQTEEAK